MLQLNSPNIAANFKAGSHYTSDLLRRPAIDSKKNFQPAPSVNEPLDTGFEPINKFANNHS